ncbi:MAG: hypothetical protein R3C62_01655 [Chloroflexota bacterium]
MSFWQRLWATKTQTSPANLPTAVSPRVLMIIHAPKINGRSLHAHFHWHNPNQLAAQYVADVAHASYGYANYQIVERIELDEFPRKADGFAYNAATYLACWQQHGGFHQPDLLDYPGLLRQFDLVRRVNSSEIDEVWLFGFPYAGYYESMMAGADAIWCNAPPLQNGRLQHRFVIMGFNYERGGGEMLENLGHRVEAIMSHVYRQQRGDANLWQQFTRYDKTYPGQAACGNVHFAPNSVRDYDWGNPTPVPSSCDDWLNFPDLTGRQRLVTCRDWGNGDTRQHHLWWLRRLPHVGGQTAGIAHNWWRYVVGNEW